MHSYDDAGARVLSKTIPHWFLGRNPTHGPTSQRSTSDGIRTTDFRPSSWSPAMPSRSVPRRVEVSLDSIVEAGGCASTTGIASSSTSTETSSSSSSSIKELKSRNQVDTSIGGAAASTPSFKRVATCKRAACGRTVRPGANVAAGTSSPSRKPTSFRIVRVSIMEHLRLICCFSAESARLKPPTLRTPDALASSLFADGLLLASCARAPSCPASARRSSPTRTGRAPAVRRGRTRRRTRSRARSRRLTSSRASWRT